MPKPRRWCQRHGAVPSIWPSRNSIENSEPMSCSIRRVVPGNAQTKSRTGQVQKQTGGHGQYGDYGLVAPLPGGSGMCLRIVWSEERFLEISFPPWKRGHGGHAGGAVLDSRSSCAVSLRRIVSCGRFIRDVVQDCDRWHSKSDRDRASVLLEPVMTVEIDTPIDAVGAVMEI